MTDTRPRRFHGLPADSAVRHALMKRLIFGAVVAVPASGLLVVIVHLMVSSLSYNPSWWEVQTPWSFVAYMAGWFWFGVPLGVSAAAGAAIALLIFSARGGSQNRAGVAALGAFIGSVIVSIVIDIIVSGFLWRTLLLGIPGGLIASGLAAAFVAWSEWSARKKAS